MCGSHKLLADLVFSQKLDVLLGHGKLSDISGNEKMESAQAWEKLATLPIFKLLYLCKRDATGLPVSPPSCN